MQTMDKILNLVRPSVRKMQPYRSARHEFDQTRAGKIFLDANENPIETGLNRYPDPMHTALRNKLASIKENILPNQIILGNGSDEIFDLIFRAFCTPQQDNCVILPPTYGMYKVLAQTNDINCIEIPLTTDWQPNIESIFKAVNPFSKLLFICSPNNPTANLVDSNKTTEIISRFKGLVVVDEAYIDFSSSKGMLPFLNKHNNLIITQTFSKAWGKAAIRLGAGYAHPEIIGVLNKIKPPYNVNQLTQNAALESLYNLEKQKKQVEAITKERQKLSIALAEINWIEAVYPSEANFLLVRTDDADKRYHQLLNRNIIVRNRSNLPGCTNCLRISIGTEEENLELMNTLKSVG